MHSKSSKLHYSYRRIRF